MQKNESRIVGIVLAGGAGRRFNGADKGLQIYHGKRLIDHTTSRLEPQVSDLVICANRNIEQYKKLGFHVTRDKDTGFQGPMAGLSAALEHLNKSDFDAALITSCDTPNIPLDLGQKLHAESGHNCLVAVAHDGLRRQNLHCLIKRGAWASLIDFYTNGERAMHRWYGKIGIQEVDFSHNADGFLNINSAERLDR